MMEISLSQGKVAMIDDVDFVIVGRHRWCAVLNGKDLWYAVTSIEKGGTRRSIRMHRMLLGLKYKGKQQADHINHNGLDNRRANLRICSHTENVRNSRVLVHKTSIYKGVCWDKNAKKWHAGISVGAGKQKHLGHFKLEECAALAYDFAAVRYHGEYAVFNF